jgi:hypothetical protein
VLALPELLQPDVIPIQHLPPQEVLVLLEGDELLVAGEHLELLLAEDLLFGLFSWGVCWVVGGVEDDFVASGPFVLHLVEQLSDSLGLVGFKIDYARLCSVESIVLTRTGLVCLEEAQSAVVLLTLVRPLLVLSLVEAQRGSEVPFLVFLAQSVETHVGVEGSELGVPHKFDNQGNLIIVDAILLLIRYKQILFVVRGLPYQLSQSLLLQIPLQHRLLLIVGPPNIFMVIY